MTKSYTQTTNYLMSSPSDYKNRINTVKLSINNLVCTYGKHIMEIVQIVIIKLGMQSHVESSISFKFIYCISLRVRSLRSPIICLSSPKVGVHTQSGYDNRFFFQVPGSMDKSITNKYKVNSKTKPQV